MRLILIISALIGYTVIMIAMAQGLSTVRPNVIKIMENR